MDVFVKVVVLLVLEIIIIGIIGVCGEVDMELECDCRWNLWRKFNGLFYVGKCCGVIDFIENK